MKRWLPRFFVFLFVVSIAAVYFFIPSTLVISRSILAPCNSDGADRYLGNEKNWSAWWPGPGYSIGGHLTHIIEVKIPEGDSSISSWIALSPMSTLDTTSIQWGCSLATSWNPIERIRQYQKARRIAKNMSQILQNMKVTIEKDNVYGIRIRETSTQDSFLVLKRIILPAKPSTLEIYEMIDFLKQYNTRNGARGTGFPMVNVTAEENGKFQTMIALPVDRFVKAAEQQDVFSRKLVQGKYLVSEIKGGQVAIDAAFEQLRSYVTDHHRTIMAIPFQSLITDRRQVPDTSQWSTRVYYPIF